MKTNFTTFLAVAALVFFSLSLTGQNQISGVINYHNNPDKPIEDVNVSLYNDVNTLVASTTTNADGEYLFAGLANGTYTVVPSADFEIAGDGIQDAFMVLMHILGYNSLTGMQFMAGDVNEDETINMTDYIMILIGWLTGGNPPPGEAWEFESLTVNMAKAKDTVFSSGGTSDVDVDGSWTPGVKPGQSVEAYFTESIEMDAETEIAIPLNVNTDIPVAGLNLVMEFPAEYMQISSVSSSMGDVNYNVQGNVLRITWMDVENKNNYDPQITINANTSSWFVGDQKISVEIMEQSHMIDPKGSLIDNVEIEMPEFTAVSNSFSMGDMYPNPTNGQLNIDYEMEEAGSVKLEIYGMNGQLITTHAVNNQFPGIYKETIDVRSLGLTPGIYSVRIALDGAQIITTKKLLVTK